MKIVTESSVAHSKAFVFLLDQYLALLKAGHADHEFSFNNSSLVTYAIEDDIILGASAWVVDPLKRIAWILFIAVAEEHRRKGIYKVISSEIESQAKKRKAVALYSTVHVDNDAMLNSIESTKNQKQWYKTKKELV